MGGLGVSLIPLVLWGVVCGAEARSSVVVVQGGVKEKGKGSLLQRRAKCGSEKSVEWLKFFPFPFSNSSFPSRLLLPPLYSKRWLPAAL